MLPKSSLIALSLVAAATLVSAQSTADDTSKQLDPSATCPWQAGDQIVQCLATVESDEATRNGGPCTTNDWECICNKQQGLIDCYLPCPGTQDAEDVQYNRDNCAGQHGVTNKAAGGDLTYTGSPLTTSYSGAVESATSASSASSSSAATPTSSSASSSATSAASSSSSGAATSGSSSSSAPAATSSGSQDDANAAPAVLSFDKAAITLAFGVVACLAVVL